MKYSRDFILKSAFDVFMNKGYDSTSISVLQEELGMSRGAMYRYFKNKEELFVSVVDEYFFRIFETVLNSVDNDQTLGELIETVHRRQKLIIKIFTRANISRAVFLNYTALMIQAAKHYPGFIGKYKKIEDRLLNSWKNALRNSIDAGEIKEDANINILCILFNNTMVRESSNNPDNDSLFSLETFKDVDRRKEVMDYLFSLIKK